MPATHNVALTFLKSGNGIFWPVRSVPRQNFWYRSCAITWQYLTIDGCVLVLAHLWCDAEDDLADFASEAGRLLNEGRMPRRFPPGSRF